MTTYSKETALYDAGAIQAAIDDAASTATAYLHFNSSTGLDVGDNGSLAKVNIEPNTGVTIYDENGNDSAVFGSSARIGESDGARVEISSSIISVMSENSVGFKVSQGSGIINTQVSESLNVIRNGISPTSLTVSSIDDAVSNTAIELRYRESNTTSSYRTLTFTAGTTETKNTYSGNATIKYDASEDSFTYTHLGGSGTFVYIKFVSVIYTAPTPAAKVEVLGELYVNDDLLIDSDWHVETRKLLWINQSPTSNWNPSNPSYISIAEEVDAVDVVYRFSTSSSQNYIFMQRVEADTESLLNCVGVQSNRNGGRSVEFTNGRVYFGTGYWNASSDNSYAIPQKIYGVRYI